MTSNFGVIFDPPPLKSDIIYALSRTHRTQVQGTSGDKIGYTANVYTQTADLLLISDVVITHENV